MKGACCELGLGTADQGGRDKEKKRDEGVMGSDTRSTTGP